MYLISFHLRYSGSFIFSTATDILLFSILQARVGATGLGISWLYRKFLKPSQSEEHPL